MLGSGFLFAAAILVAVLVVGARWLSRRAERTRRARALSTLPGMSPDHPLRIRSFREMDDAVDELRCPCGAPLNRIGEGSRPGLRVVRCECVACEEDVDLFFDLAELRH